MALNTVWGLTVCSLMELFFFFFFFYLFGCTWFLSWHTGSGSLIRDGTRASCTRSLNPWTTREVLLLDLLTLITRKPKFKKGVQ